MKKTHWMIGLVALVFGWIPSGFADVCQLCERVVHNRNDFERGYVTVDVRVQREAGCFCVLGSADYNPMKCTKNHEVLRDESGSYRQMTPKYDDRCDFSSEDFYEDVVTVEKNGRPVTEKYRVLQHNGQTNRALANAKRERLKVCKETDLLSIRLDSSSPL